MKTIKYYTVEDIKHLISSELDDKYLIKNIQIVYPNRNCNDPGEPEFHVELDI